MEFWFASIKILTIVGVIILGIVVDLGGTNGDRLGFRYWKDPGIPWSRSYLYAQQLTRIESFRIVCSGERFRTGPEISSSDRLSYIVS